MYCKNCGIKLPEGQNHCPSCGAGPNIGRSFCAGCGAPIGYGYACPSCGIPSGYNLHQDIYPPNKSRLCAGLLGIFLGMFGAHNFYLGNTGKAVAQLLISVLSCCILCGISAIWGLIEGIMILSGSIDTDGRGMPLGE